MIRHIDIELTNDCNLSCYFCERSKMTRKVGYMEYELFKDIIDECCYLEIKTVKLNLWGESLLHKDLYKMIRYARGKVETQLSTNGKLLNGGVFYKLGKAGLDRLTISVSAGSFKPFKRRLPVPILTLQFLQTVSNKNKTSELLNEFKDFADLISVTHISSMISDKQILSQSLVKYGKRKLCEEPRRRRSILWNGDVTMCCMDYNGLLTVGSLKTKPLKELIERTTPSWICGDCTQKRETYDRIR